MMRGTVGERSLRASWSLGFLIPLAFMLLIAGCTEAEVTSPTETVRVSLLVQVEDKDPRWFRDVEVSKGTDAYELTEQVTEGDIKATYYPGYRSHFVEAILGTENENPRFWLAWVWSEPQNKWEPLPVGADLYSLKDGHVLAWYYAEPSLDGNPPPVTP